MSAGSATPWGFVTCKHEDIVTTTLRRQRLHPGGSHLIFDQYSVCLNQATDEIRSQV